MSRIKSIITETVIEFLNEINASYNDKPKKNIVVNNQGHEEFKPSIGIKVPVPKMGSINPNDVKKLSNTGGTASMNEVELSEEDKKAVEEAVNKSLKREGFLAFTFGTNIDEGKTTLGVRIDPSAKGNWILGKEELLYEMPLKYNNILHEYVKHIRKSLNS